MSDITRDNLGRAHDAHTGQFVSKEADQGQRGRSPKIDEGMKHDVVGHDTSSGHEVFLDKNDRAHDVENGKFVADQNVDYQ
ncbi:unnamed protein product, partial [Mesorhabditis belari]